MKLFLVVHVIRPRGYEVCVAIPYHAYSGNKIRQTIRAFPVTHGPVTSDNRLGWDPIDNRPLPRWKDVT